MSRDLTACVDGNTGYIINIDDIRASEYQSLENIIYLDHAGTTLYPKSLIEDFSADLTNNIFGNPHSASASSQLSSQRINDVRLQVLRFFKADPDHFQVVFTPNATAAIKLVADAFRDHPASFDYAYHVDSHTSLVGVRELAASSQCLRSGQDVSAWLSGHDGITDTNVRLLAYPGQSNMTGARHSFKWAQEVNSLRKCIGRECYTLFDAAAFASTSPIDLSDMTSAPDFTAVSFYKIFGFPDLGALLVKKASASVLLHRKYFGGGTVDSVAILGDQWHAKKNKSISASLEDGTLPFHNIIALQHALRIHFKLYGHMQNVSNHCKYLATRLRQQMQDLRHANGARVCNIYGADSEDDDSSCGPVVAFNLLDNEGGVISNSEVEKLAVVRSIHLRTGGLCNPGGIATHLKLDPNDLRANYAAGYRCGSENDLVNGKPTGTIRVSLGAPSNLKDIQALMDMLKEFYVDTAANPVARNPGRPGTDRTRSGYVIESLTVFPIKSCAAFNIESETRWKVGPRGLAWDREWCLVHQGTHQALSQKKYPRMALLRPTIDLNRRMLRVRHNIHGSGWQNLEISLDEAPTKLALASVCDALTSLKTTSVCGEPVDIEHYLSLDVSRFFTNALGVPCTLARFPETGVSRQPQIRSHSAFVSSTAPVLGQSIALANESPILLISRSSVNRLNENIKAGGSIGKTVPAESFRGNIVISEELDRGQSESPYAEDDWGTMQVDSDLGRSLFRILGPCQRCQMVCIDQADASRRQEPFSTLAKTRKRYGKVWFGMHLTLSEGGTGSLKVGDRVCGLQS
jgi:molybdenum cofactor sulfurtransferase